MNTHESQGAPESSKTWLTTSVKGLAVSAGGLLLLCCCIAILMVTSCTLGS
jgi:hypothetical protein